MLDKIRATIIVVTFKIFSKTHTHKKGWGGGVDCDDCQSHGDKAIWNQEADAVLSRVRKQLAQEVAVVR